MKNINKYILNDKNLNRCITIEKIISDVSDKTSVFLCGDKNINITKNKKIKYKLENVGLETNLIIEDIEGSESMGYDELEKLFLDEIVFLENKGFKIGEIIFTDVLEKEKKLKNDGIIEVNNTIKNLYKIISNNFPILGIGRIKKGYNIVNIRFGGVKIINDNISKEFTDFLIKNIKDELYKNNIKYLNNIDKNNNYGSKKILSNYKNLTLSVDGNFDLAKDLFNAENIEDFLNKIISNLDKKEFIKLSKKTNLKVLEGEDIEKKIKYFILKNFYIGIGKYNNLYENIDGKTESLYKAIISSKNKIEGNINKGINEYNLDDTKKIAKEIIDIENKIIEEYKNKYFSYEGGEKLNIIVDINGEYKINNILIERVRKNKQIKFYENNSSNELKDSLLKYTKLLNDGFYFLMPELSINNGQKTFNKINNYLNSGKIDSNYLVKNYKGFDNKKYLEKKVKDREGIKIFVDVIGNSFLNFKLFKGIINKINNSDFTNNNIDELLKVCDKLTMETVNIFYDFLKENEKAEISLSGDEIFIFIPGINESNKELIIKKLLNNLTKSNMEFRVVNTLDKKISFDELDFLTSLNKFFEEKLMNNKFGLTKNIILNVDDKFKKEILNIKLENNFQKIVEEINKINFSTIEFADFVKNNNNGDNIKFTTKNFEINILNDLDNKSYIINIAKLI